MSLRKGLITVSACHANNKDEVLATVQISINADIDRLMQEITRQLNIDSHVSVQLLLGEKFLVGPGTLKEHGVTEGSFVTVLRKRGLVVTGSADKTGMVWDCRSGKPTFILKGHDDVVNSVAFSPDNRFIATGSSDCSSKIWSLENGSCIATISNHRDAVASAVFSLDGTLLLTGSLDATAKIWQLPETMLSTRVEKDNTVECILNLEGHEKGVSSAVFSCTGRVATGSLDGTAKVWSLPDGKCLATATGHTGHVYSVAFSPDGLWLVTGSQDMTARVWKPTSRDSSCACQLALEGHKGSVTSVAFSADGSLILTASTDRCAKVWDARKGVCLHTLQDHTKGVNAASFSRNGKYIVTGSSDNQAKVWKFGNGSPQCSLTIMGHGDSIRSAAFSSI